MRSISLTSFLAPLIVLLAPLTGAGASFTPLGDLPGGFFASQAYDVSSDGTRVTGPGNSSGTQAFIWDATSGMREITPEPGDGFSSLIGFAISGDGSTVAGRGRGILGDEAFIWNEANGVQSLGTLPSTFPSSQAFGISDDGAIVVGTSLGPGGNNAFIWDATNGMQSLGDLPGGRFWSVAQGITGDGTTVVGSGVSAEGGEAFIWNAVDGMQGIGDLPGGSFSSRAFDVSDDGATVVGQGASAAGNEAFIWDATNGMRGLGDLPGGDFASQARAVSADGMIVVGEGASATGREAFVWDAANGMQSLQVMLNAMGVDLPGWQLTGALGVSADGSTIVGFGTNPSGYVEAFIAVIPEPGPAILLGLGLSVLSSRREIDRKHRVSFSE